MKTLFVVTYEYPYGVGEQFFETEASVLSENFDNIYIFSINGNKHKRPTRQCPSGITVFPLNCPKSKFRNLLKGIFSSKKGFDVKASGIKQKLVKRYYIGRKTYISNSIYRIIKKHKLDANNCILYSYWLSFASAIISVKNKLLAAGDKNIKTISRAHGYDLYWERMPLGYSGLQSASVNQLDAIYSVSETGRQYLINKYSEHKDKIKCLRLGTNDFGLNKFDSNMPFAFVTCSDNRKIKRLDLFAEAFNKLCESNENISWHAIGIDSDAQSVTEKLNDKSLKKVIFYGNVLNNKVPSIYLNNSFGCFINVSSLEGLPVSIMEAMSFGLPIIATNVGGNKELVDDSNGILLASNPSIDEIVDATEKIIKMNKSEYGQMRANSRAKWLKLVDAKKNFDEWIKALKEL